MIAAPWAPKIFYGIIIDTFPIFGSTKKSYLIILGTIFSICAFSTGLFDFKKHVPIVALIAITQICSAMMDVVVDGLSVSQSRIDPKLGSQDLQAFITLTAGISGMTGYLLGGILTQAGYARESFLIVAVIALLINISACFLDKKFETMEKILKMSLCERTSHNFGMIKQGFSIKELRNFFIYYII